MPTRKARIVPRGAPDSAKEYRKGVENIDRPTWKREQAEDMEKRYAEMTNELAEFRSKAVVIIRKHVGTALVPNYMRAVLKAWRLERLNIPSNQYKAELEAVIAKNGLDRAKLNAIFKELGLGTV